LEEIEREVRKLIEVSCFDVEVKEVSFDPDGRVFIRIDGPDNSLLIGREGYRYASLNTLLFVWLHQKYRLKLRLEVGDFLQNQTEMVKKLIAPTIEEVKESGSGRTPPLKGFLPYLAQELLRKEFPRMYVKVKELNGEKFVIVRPFYGHNSSYWNA
jgi:spoIIIJ-associated protein